MAIIANTLIKGSDNLEVEFTILQQNNSSELIEEENYWVDYDINRLNSKIAKLDKDIDIITNDADKLDNAIAIASGLLCGFIDSFFVGTFSFEEGMKITNQEIEHKIIDLAKKHGWKGLQKGERKGQQPLDSAIKFLERKFQPDKKTGLRDRCWRRSGSLYEGGYNDESKRLCCKPSWTDF